MGKTREVIINSATSQWECHDPVLLERHAPSGNLNETGHMVGSPDIFNHPCCDTPGIRGDQ